ncbi:MAG: prolyl oligopeptidase family protein [Chlamydiales bacterium]
MRCKLLLLLISVMTSLSASPSENPYGWLENSEDARTQDWLKQQQTLFDEYISSSPIKSEIKSSLKHLSNSDIYSIPRKSGDNYFYTRKKPSDEQDILYMQKGLDGIPRVLFDPNLSKTKSICIENFVASPDGNYLAYGISENGSDWITCKVMNIHSQSNLTESVEKIKFTPIVWSANSQGFFYSRYDSDVLHSVHYHALGTSQDEDRLIFRDLQDLSFEYEPYISADNRYLIINALHGSYGPNTINYIDLEASDPKPVTMIPYDGADYSFIRSKGTKFYFLTNKDAPFRKVIVIDISQHPHLVGRDVIPEGKFLLESIVPIGDYFGTVISENVANKLVLFDDQGKIVRHISLPSLGRVTLSRINQNTNEMKDELFFSFTNLFQPSTIYRYSLKSATAEIFRKPSLDIDSQNYQIQQVFFRSKDGTRIPMFIAHKKGIKIDGNNQVLLTGYGAYGINSYPVFNEANMLWIERGGVFALVNVRGGSEYGEGWHKGGMRENKQNSFDDFIAAAEWLIENKYTKPDRLATIGVSSGGLLVAASANQRPDLFGTVVVEVGLLDMHRFHLFTIGHSWISDFGDPENPKDLAYLSLYSPCHNVREGIKYPAILITTSENDDRVVPSHSYKYLAALQNAHTGDKKKLLRLNKNDGHYKFNSTNWIDERADILTFIYRELEK